MLVLGEIKHATKHLKKWMAPQRMPTALQFMPGKNRLIPQPLGVVGIIAPWNYPLQLTLAPAIGAIAAGNRVMIKPSELTPRFSALLEGSDRAKIRRHRDARHRHRGRDRESFATLPFDHLIFTGSTRVGRLVAEAAGRNLTPVTLELGGKSPAIVDRSADLDEAAERIAYGKTAQCRPDLHRAGLCAGAGRLRAGFRRQGAQATCGGCSAPSPNNKDYTSIISDRHYARLEGLVADAARQGREDHAAGASRTIRLEGEAQVSADHRGRRDAGDGADAGGDLRARAAGDGLSATRSEPIAYINKHDRPLALYWFGRDDAARDEVLARTVSGGVTVNDCLFHFTQINQPMGGVGASGTGAYHGEWGFNTLEQAEAGVLSLGAQPPGRSLSALWRQDRAAGEDAAVHVVITTTVIPGRCEATRPESRDSGFDAAHRPGMTTKSGGKYA